MIPGTFPFATLKKTRSSGFVIEGSGLFDGSSGYLYRAQGETSNQRTFTYNIVAKGIGSGTSLRNLLLAYKPSDFENDERYFNFYVTNEIVLELWGGEKLNTTQVFRDPSAYYDILLAIDTTQSTASNRVKLYVNGTQITAFDIASYPSQNAIYAVNNTDSNLNIGARVGVNNDGYWYGNIARACLIDGLQLAPTDFGEVTDDGFWQINDASDLTFGNNGFLLEGGTAMAAGTDSSGNTNNFTKAGTITATDDSPTNGGDDDDEYGNYITFDAAARRTSLTTLSDGNRTVTGARTPNYADSAPFNMALPSTSSELFYMEVKVTSVGLDTFYLGVSTPDWPWAATNPSQIGQSSSNPYAIAIATWGSGSGCRIYVNGSVNTMSTTMVNNDRLLLAIKPSTGKVWVGMYDVSGTSTIWIDSSGTERTSDEPGSGTNATGTIPNADLLLPGVSPRQNSGVNGNGTLYAEEGDWIATVPNGAKAIATQNLPEPAIINYEDEYYIEANISHSNGSTTAVTLPKSVSGGAMVRIKRTNTTGDWYMFDTVRGANKFVLWNSSAVEDTSTFSDQNLTGTTFTIPSGMASGTYLLECFFVGSYFQIHPYSGTGSAKTESFPGTLDTAPGFMAFMERTGSDAETLAYHESTGNTGYLMLQSTYQFSTGSGFLNNTSPTTTQFTVGTMTNVNGSGNTYVCYAWANSGPYAFGSATANASADGPVINMGGSPQSVTLKTITRVQNWYATVVPINDGNVMNTLLLPDATDAAYTSSATIDIVSTGVKIRANGGGTPNATSGDTIISMAFGIQPLTDGSTNQGRAR